MSQRRLEARALRPIPRRAVAPLLRPARHGPGAPGHARRRPRLRDRRAHRRGPQAAPGPLHPGDRLLPGHAREGGAARRRRALLRARATSPASRTARGYRLRPRPLQRRAALGSGPSGAPAATPRDCSPPGGQLAVQVPANQTHASHRLANELAREEPFATALQAATCATARCSRRSSTRSRSSGSGSWTRSPAPGLRPRARGAGRRRGMVPRDPAHRLREAAAPRPLAALPRRLPAAHRRRPSRTSAPTSTRTSGSSSRAPPG